MAKEVAIGKRAKITEAQQYVMLAALGASVVLGACLALVVHFMRLISFNSNVIAEEEKAIVDYSNAIKNIGICAKPSGTIYSDDELKKCNPNTISVSSIPGTLRANILNNIAANKALNSVQKEDSNNTCYNPTTGKNYTYDEMTALYDSATSSAERAAASALIQSCSALRVIPDALPAFRNEEALLASLNKIFNISYLEPESLSPTNSSSSSVSDAPGKVGNISVRLSVEADSSTTIKFLDNIEHSIREFHIERATIEWGQGNTLKLQAQATAYYISPSELKEIKKTIEGDKEKEEKKK